MGYVVAQAELWNALKEAGMEAEATALADESAAIMDKYAKQLAERFELTVTPANMEHHELGGLAVVFGPTKKGQPIPPCLEYCDSESEWADDELEAA